MVSFPLQSGSVLDTDDLTLFMCSPLDYVAQLGFQLLTHFQDKAAEGQSANLGVCFEKRLFHISLV